MSARWAGLVSAVSRIRDTCPRTNNSKTFCCKNSPRACARGTSAGEMSPGTEKTFPVGPRLWGRVVLLGPTGSRTCCDAAGVSRHVGNPTQGYEDGGRCRGGPWRPRRPRCRGQGRWCRSTQSSRRCSGTAGAAPHHSPYTRPDSNLAGRLVFPGGAEVAFHSEPRDGQPPRIGAVRMFVLCVS